MEPVRHLAAGLPPLARLLKPNRMHQASEVLKCEVARVGYAGKRELPSR